MERVENKMLNGWMLGMVILGALLGCFYTSQGWAQARPPGSGSAAESIRIGEVKGVQGLGEIRSATDGRVKRLGVNSPIHMMDTVISKENSKVWLKRASRGDETDTSLGQASSFTPVEYRREGAASSFIGDISKGVVRIVKKLPKTSPESSYALTAGAALVSVMQTADAADFVVEVNKDAETTVTVLFGSVAVRNLSEALQEVRILKSCQKVVVEENQEPWPIMRASWDEMQRLIERTTIPMTLAANAPSCQPRRAALGPGEPGPLAPSEGASSASAEPIEGAPSAPAGPGGGDPSLSSSQIGGGMPPETSSQPEETDTPETPTEEPPQPVDCNAAEEQGKQAATDLQTAQQDKEQAEADKKAAQEARDKAEQSIAEDQAALANLQQQHDKLVQQLADLRQNYPQCQEDPGFNPGCTDYLHQKQEIETKLKPSSIGSGYLEHILHNQIVVNFADKNIARADEAIAKANDALAKAAQDLKTAGDFQVANHCPVAESPAPHAEEGPRGVPLPPPAMSPRPAAVPSAPVIPTKSVVQVVPTFQPPPPPPPRPPIQPPVNTGTTGPKVQFIPIKPITFLPVQPSTTGKGPEGKTGSLPWDLVKPPEFKTITVKPITPSGGPDPDGGAPGPKTAGDKGTTPQPAQPTGGGQWTVKGGPDPDAGAPGSKPSGDKGKTTQPAQPTGGGKWTVTKTGPDPDAGAPGSKTDKSGPAGPDLKANLPGKGGQAQSPAKPIPTLQSAGGKSPQPRDMDKIRDMASKMRSDQQQRVSTGLKAPEKPSAAGTAKPGTAPSQPKMQAKTQPQDQVRSAVSQPRPSPKPFVQPRPQPQPVARPAVTPTRPAAVHRPPSVSRGPSHARRRMGPESGEAAKSCPPIVLAALDGDSHKVKEILNQPAEINSKDSEGTTALMAAVSAGNTELVKMLLDKAAADKAISKQKVINAKDNSGRTALMAACEEDRPEVAKLLVERGAGVSASDNEGVTALMIACQLQQPEVVKLLLNSRAGVNAATKDGWTALMFASAGEDIEVVRLLLEKGANVNSRAKSGSTPLKIASEGDNRQIAKLLQDKGANLEGRQKQEDEETTYEYGIWIIPYWQ